MVNGRAIVERKTVHVPDLAAEIETEFPSLQIRTRNASALAPFLLTPLLREGVPIGDDLDSPNRSASLHREAN